MKNRSDGSSGYGAVEKVLAAKRTNPAADTSMLEREIDQQVYALYGMTPDEIKIVETSAK